MSITNYMKNLVASLAIAACGVMSVPASAEAVAWWRCDGETTDGAFFPNTNQGSDYTSPAITDATGNGNSLFLWQTDNGAVGSTEVAPGISGTNELSALFNGDDDFYSSSPDLTTAPPTGYDIETDSFAAWSVEALVNLTSIESYQTIMGREGAADGGSLSQLYFQVTDGNLFRCYYCDGSGTYQEVISTTAVVADNWYYVCVTSDGSTLSMYVADLTGGDTSATAEATSDISGSTDSSFGPYGDSTFIIVGRGYYGGQADKFNGYIDEVKFHNVAIDPNIGGLIGAGLPTAALASTVTVTTPFDAIYGPDETPEAQTAVVEIESIGSDAMTVTSVTATVPGFSDTVSVDFGSTTLPTSLGTNQTIEFNVNLTPSTEAGSHDVVLNFDTTDDDLTTMTLSGVKVLPEITQDLVIFYTFDETSGSIAYDTSGSANVNNGDICGDDMSVATAEGVIGSAYYSPQTADDYVSIDATSGNATLDSSCVEDLLFNSSSAIQFSIGSWIKFDEAATDGQIVMGNIDFGRNITDDRDGFGMFRNEVSSQGLIVRLYADDEEWVYDEDVYATFTNDDVWEYHLVTVDLQGDMLYYVNGELRDTAAYIASTDTPDIGISTIPFVIGNNANPLGAVDTGADAATFDEFAVWHRVVEPEEVEAIYYNGYYKGTTLPEVTAPLSSANAVESWTIFE